MFRRTPTGTRRRRTSAESHLSRRPLWATLSKPPAFVPSDEALLQLAEQMLEPADPGGEGGGEDQGLDGAIPAGYTYLGQFIDHDITFDPVSSLQRLN